MAEKKSAASDPTVKSPKTSPTAPVPIHDADDAATSRKYIDMPEDMKPAPETVAQLQVLPEDESR